MQRIGKYMILGELGQGGMGVVYKGRDAIINREVAIKLIQERALNVEKVKKRFFQEARSAGKLSHENIMIIYDVGLEDGKPFIVMEYLEGRDLREILNEEVPLSDEDKLNIAAQICRGLHYAHQQGVIHRDIKPANIRILPNGRVKIMDFGIARIQAETQGLTQTNMSLGTPGYMAPEQIKSEEIDHQADIFSFGVLFYELVTGIKPFKSDNVAAVVYAILHTDPPPLTAEHIACAEELQPILSKCLAKDREERYQDFGDVLRDLLPLVTPHDERLLRSRPPTWGDTVLGSPPGPRIPSRTNLPRDPSRTAQAATLAPSTTPAPQTGAQVADEPSPTKKGLWMAVGLVLVVALALGSYFIFRPLGDTGASAALQQTDPAPSDAAAAAAAAMTDSLVDGEVIPLDRGEEATDDEEDPADVQRRRTAEQVRTRMEQAWQRVIDQRSDPAVAALYQQAIAARRAGAVAFERAAYEAAAVSFRTAADLFVQIRRTLDAQNTTVAQADTQDPGTDPPEQEATREEGDPDPPVETTVEDKNPVAEVKPAEKQDPVVDVPEETVPEAIGSVAEADRARTALEAAKRRVSTVFQSATSFTRGVELERRGDTAYQEQAYDRAVSHYVQAQGFFEDAAAVEAEAHAMVQRLVDLFKVSLEQEDDPTLMSVFHLPSYEALFETARDLKATISYQPVQFATGGTQASVAVSVQLDYKDPKPRTASVRYAWTLEYRPSGWALTRADVIH